MIPIAQARDLLLQGWTRQKAPWEEAAWIFGLSRLMIILISYLSITFLPRAPQNNAIMLIGPKCVNNITCFLLSWWRWDAVHYIQIAHDGYNLPPLTTFFPLFPLLIHSVGFLLGGSEIADYAAGLIVANSCFYANLVLFYYLVSKDFGHSVAKYALVYLAFAAYGIFFFVGYAESLFLLLTLAIFVFLRRGKPIDWWLAGLCGFLAALTRPTGITLMIPFLSLFVQKFGIHTGATPKGGTVNWAPTIGNKLRNVVASSSQFTINNLPIGRGPRLLSIIRARWLQKLNTLLPIVLIPAGLLTYLLYQRMAFGNLWLFSAEEAHYWQRYLAFPWVGFFNVMHEIVTAGPLSQWCLNDAIFTLWPLGSLIMGWKLLPLHYSLFSLTMILFVLCEPSQYEGLLSVPRLLLVVFPIFILFALWSQYPRVAWYFLVPSVIFFAIHIMQFAVYWWVA